MRLTISTGKSLSRREMSIVFPRVKMAIGSGHDATSRFSNRVENYIRYRPGYPDEIMNRLRMETGLTGACIVADIGSGTGIFTEKFLKHGNTVYAVEPNFEMRSGAERLLPGYPGFKSINGTAEATTLAAHSIDLIVAGQAFHWFDRDKARAEFGRILKSGGFVALVWNTRKTRTTPFLRKYERLLQAFSLDYQQVDHRNVTGESLESFFGSFRKFSFSNNQSLDLEAISGRLLSSSYAPLAGHLNFEPMMRELRQIFHEHEIYGKVRIEYDTELYVGQPGR